MNNIESLKCELEELKCELQKYKESDFQIISMKEAVNKYLEEPNVVVFMINVTNSAVEYISDIPLYEVKDAKDSFYVISRKGLK